MRPNNLKTKIFLDSGDVNETKQLLESLGFLDGQTTNPTLIAKNPDAQKRLAEGKKYTKDEVYAFYKSVVTELSNLIPQGSISVEVYADKNTTALEMLNQGKEMFSWISNAHIKYPTTKAGLEAAQKSVQEGMRVNMTLCFSQEQAAAVYAATKGAKTGDVFVSPFVGRLDDRGENGMDLIKNIIEMFKSGDGHVEVLTASVRNLGHFLYTLKLESDIMTSPFKVIEEWVEKGMNIPGGDYIYNVNNLEEIPYQEINLNKDWQDYDIHHELTDIGIEKFSADWNNLIQE